MNTLFRRFFALAILLLLAVALPPGESAAAQSTDPPEILVLGTFHMANPGRDVHNTKADDMLSARRQGEMEELLEVLETFRPTAVAVEASATSGAIASLYQAYLDGEHTLNRNERQQIGFRLARRAGLETVHSVDVDGDFPYYRVQNYAIANDMKARFDSLTDATGERVARAQEFLRSHTLLEMLEYINADSTSAVGVGEYYGFVPFGEPYEYAGPDLLAAWFQRNIRIYHNIRRLATAPGDRVLVVYGAGHLGWLQQMAQDDPAVRLRTLGDLTGRSERTSTR